jgi:hypothetical protein
MLNVVPKISENEFTSLAEYEKLIAVIDLPNDWWYVKNSYDFNSPVKNLKLLSLKGDTKMTRTNSELPKPNYWEIKQGDYRSRAEKSKLIESKKNKKKLEIISLTAVIIISIILVSVLSSFLTRI